jgi:hypothetical protein
MQTTRNLIGGLLVIALVMSSSTVVQAQIFEANINGFVNDGTVSEYSTSGTLINSSVLTGLYEPFGLVASGNDLFVSESNGPGTVGEYTTSGGTVNASLITGLGFSRGIASFGSNLYVASSNGTIGEYTIDATNGTVTSSNASLVTGLSDPFNLALSGTDLFVLNAGNNTVGEYTTSGQTVNASLISGFTPSALAVSGGYLFVVNQTNGTIGEYTTSGATINASLVTGLPGGDYGLAVSGSELLVSQYGNAQLNAGSGSIYQYNIDAAQGTVTSSNTSFITGLYEPRDIAFATPEPSTWAMLLGGLGLLAFCYRRKLNA